MTKSHSIFAAIVYFVGLLSSCTFTSDKTPLPCSTKVEQFTSCRPMRAGILRFGWKEDDIKPLAPTEFAGWALATDTLIGTQNKQWVTAYSLKENRNIWWYKTDIPVSTQISIFGSWAVLGLQDGTITKLETLTGTKVWSVNVGHFASRSFALIGADLLVYTSNHQLFSLNFQSGKTNWIYDAGPSEKLILRQAAPPIASAGKVYLGTANGEVHCIDQATGQAQWKASPGFSDSRFHEIVGDLILLNNRLIAARYDGTVAALSLEDSANRVIWKNNFSGITIAKLHEGIIYLGSINGDINAIEAFTGNLLWTVKTGQSIQSLTIGDKTIYAASAQGRITALSLKHKGLVLWIDDIEASLSLDPIIFDGKIYFISPLKLLYSYKLQ